MKVINYPERKDWAALLQRPYVDNRSVVDSVQQILNAVKQHGDEAIRSFSKKFDGVDLADFPVSEQEMERAVNKISVDLRNAILQAKDNIEKFHLQQISSPHPVETMPGVQCWRKNVGIEKVGLYVPGGTAPLFSTVLMLAVPAGLAGCKEVILCTPADRNGEVHPAILYSARLAGVDRIYKIGGAQAIAAMAYGTETIGAVYKILGPGNQYVTAAKQLVQLHGVSIDMPAGPSEVCILADDTASPVFVAADLLSQAEHGVDSQVLLVTSSESLLEMVNAELEAQILQLSRKEIAQKALDHSKGIVVSDLLDGVEMVNLYAPEHLIISCQDADSISEKIINAGSVFIGNYSPESVGDYASGTNHTLPTNGFARAYSGVSIDSFVKKITFQKLTRSGLQAISTSVMTMANAEGLDAHAQAVRVRLNN